MISGSESFDFAKSSAFSLKSIINTITVNSKRQKKKVTRYFLSIYQSSIFMPVSANQRNLSIKIPAKCNLKLKQENLDAVKLIR